MSRKCCSGFRDVIGVEDGSSDGGISSSSWKNQANSQVKDALFVTASGSGIKTLL